jgi:hypothetical protein
MPPWRSSGLPPIFVDKTDGPIQVTSVFLDLDGCHVQEIQCSIVRGHGEVSVLGCEVGWYTPCHIRTFSSLMA